jgi:hypothetical protein
MKRSLWVIGAMVAMPLAEACCISYADAAMTLADERAIIVWDQEAKVQHFIRSARFEGEAKDFGFILPTPTQPTAIEVANEEVFGLLEAARPSTMGCGPKSDAAAGGLEVLEQKMVGDFQVTVLKAKEGKSVADWLAKNGHKMRPAMEPWLDHYAERGWILTAFKYDGPKSKEPTNAVRVSFKSEFPHYPYKMPTDTWSSPSHHRQLDLFVVSQTAMKGFYNNAKPWETAANWSNKLNEYNRTRLAEFLGTKGKPLNLPLDLTVTRFVNVPEATGYEYDLIFEPDNPPYWALWLGFGAFGYAGYAWWRRSRVKE